MEWLTSSSCELTLDNTKAPEGPLGLDDRAMGFGGFMGACLGLLLLVAVAAAWRAGGINALLVPKRKERLAPISLPPGMGFTAPEQLGSANTTFTDAELLEMVLQRQEQAKTDNPASGLLLRNLVQVTVLLVYSKKQGLLMIVI